MQTLQAQQNVRHQALSNEVRNLQTHVHHNGFVSHLCSNGVTPGGPPLANDENVISFNTVLMLI